VESIKNKHYIEVKDMSFSYGDEPVLSGIHFTVDPVEFVLLTGENGAAKTTLLRNILGLVQPTTGESYIAEKNRNGRELKVGYVSKRVASFNTGSPSNGLELVESGRYSKNRWSKRLDTKENERVSRAT